MEYRPQEIEKKWQQKWAHDRVYQAEFPSQKPKYYVLDMFPYPSGAGLHVGHLLGYIATDIISRYKRLKGYNVLHPMGYDSFGLPAEQYAIQTGQHPAITTQNNIARYKEQLDRIGLGYDWSREVRTSDPSYYRWTQWIFLQLFNSWYDTHLQKARSIQELMDHFALHGTQGLRAYTEEGIYNFTSQEWNSWNEAKKHEATLPYRLAYVANTFVNWCPGLGTVLANEEVKDGVSERGGYPVIRKEMPQWQLRITAYAERLLADLDTVDWPEAIKEQQRNWIGKSKGCMLRFDIQGSDKKIEVFTTRADTLFGVTYLTLAPEHELIDHIVSADHRDTVDQYRTYAKNRSERDRMSDVKTVSGAFTGAYAIHPFTQAPIPIWIGEYVLAGYGTGAVMAVPSSDTRDYAFAKHFGLPIIDVQEGAKTDITQPDFDPKAGTMINSDFLNGLAVPQAIDAMIQRVESMGVGYGKVNYRIRDSIFSRQRYWGEPIPIYFKDGVPYALPETELPLTLPPVDKYLPTEEGEPPLARASSWHKDHHPLEASTMPGWAGSSWYFFRYMDPTNDQEFASKPKLDYWKSVDLYLGGSEHATGHLLYSRFWTKFLYDIGKISVQEYALKLVNQGMIQGRSSFVYRVNGTQKFVSLGLRDNYNTTPIHVDIHLVKNDVLDLEGFKKFRDDFANAEFILEEGKYICGSEVEKMSKSKYNVVNPDEVIEKYGADTLRLFEMFLGPLELSKPWNTSSISGISRFLRNFWKLYYDEKGSWRVLDGAPSPKELKVLHKTIKKIEEDMERLSFNTSVSTFMVCTNELHDLQTTSRHILEPLLVLLSAYAPHICEELWHAMGHSDSIVKASFPEYKEEYTKDNEFEYPISINGKLRHKMLFGLDTPSSEIEKSVLEAEEVKKWLGEQAPKKIIVVPNKIVNVVI